MMARNQNVPFKGRIQKRKTCHLQIITFGLQRAAGQYRWARRRPEQAQRIPQLLDHFVDNREQCRAGFRSANYSAPVCAENLDSHILVMQAANHGMRRNKADLLDRP